MDKFAPLFARGGLSLDRLRTLCLVATAGSLTRAAEGDLGRVSLFSRQLKELETYFGASLVQRRGKLLGLTVAGQELARLAERHFLEFLDFQRFCAGTPLEITLGAGASVIEWIVMARLPALRTALSQARITLWRARSENLSAHLREMQIDVAITRENAVMRPLKSKRLGVFGYILYVPRRLAGPARRIASWLPQVPMMAPAEGWTRDRVRTALAAAGIEPRFEVESGSATLAVRALRSGEYAAILPEIAAPELAGADVVALRPPFITGIQRRLCVAWHPRMAEARPMVARAVEEILTWRDTLPQG
jgi:DNA-binding transcriptional LysR family regulator